MKTGGGGLNHLTLYNTNYAYRLKTRSIFEQDKIYIFDIFVVHNDIKLEEFNLHKNLWRETLLLQSI